MKYLSLIFTVLFAGAIFSAYPQDLEKQTTLRKLAAVNPDFVEFVLSVRGQGLNEPTDVYGDWITYGLSSKETYYYRGAFMDLIRGIDFVASCNEVDTRNIFAEGGSQDGAFTLVACTLAGRANSQKTGRIGNFRQATFRDVEPRWRQYGTGFFTKHKK